MRRSSSFTDTQAIAMFSASETPSAATSAMSKLEFNKLQKRLRRHTGQAIEDFQMIEEGDRVMVCLSGGKLCPVNIL